MQQKGAGLIMTITANKRSDQVQIVSLQTAQNADWNVPREWRARTEEPQSDIGHMAKQS